MASKASLLSLFVIVCILMHETIAEGLERPKACTDPAKSYKSGILCHFSTSEGYTYDALNNACIKALYNYCSDTTDNIFETNEECRNTCWVKPEIQEKPKVAKKPEPTEPPKRVIKRKHYPCVNILRIRFSYDLNNVHDREVYQQYLNCRQFESFYYRK